MSGHRKSHKKTEQILQSACKLFFSHGFKGSSMEAIAHGAGVSKQTLYSHFKDKDDLYRNVMHWKLDKYQFSDNRIDVTTNIEQDLNILGTHFLNLILDPESVAMFRTVVSESSTHPKISELFYENGPKKVISELTNYLQNQNISEASFKAVIFISMIDGEWHMKSIMNLQKQKPSESEIKAFIKKIVANFMKML